MNLASLKKILCVFMEMQEKKEDPTKTHKTEVLASSSAGLRLGDLKDARKPEDPRRAHTSDSSGRVGTREQTSDN